MKDEERVNQFMKKEIRKKFKGCISLYKKESRLRKKGVRLFFKVLKEFKSPGIGIGKPRKEISLKETAVSVDIYSLIPFFEQGFVKTLLEKKFSFILDMKNVCFKLRTIGKEIPLTKIEDTKKKELLRQISANFKNIEYIRCW